MAGFVLVRFWFLVKLKAARVIKSLGNSTSVSFRERRRETLFIDARVESEVRAGGTEINVRHFQAA